MLDASKVQEEVTIGSLVTLQSKSNNAAAAPVTQQQYAPEMPQLLQPVKRGHVLLYLMPACSVLPNAQPPLPFILPPSLAAHASCHL